MKRLVKFTFIAVLGFVLNFSIQFFPQITALPATPTQNSLLTSVQTGKNIYDAGQFSQAAKVLQKVAKVYKARRNVLGEAQTLGFISLVYQELGRTQEAKTAINTSLSLLDQLEIQGNDFKRVRAQILNSQGRLQWKIGDPQKALESFQVAESLYTSASDSEGVIGSQINQAQALQTLGFYRRSYNLLNSIQEKLQALPDSPVKVAGLHNLSNIFRQKGELDSSQKLLEESLEIIRQIDDAEESSLPNSPQNESKILLSLGNTNLALAMKEKELKNPQGAEKYIQLALSLYQQAAIKTNLPTIEIQAKLNQFSLLVKTKKNEQAWSLLPEIFKSLKQLPVSRSSIYSRVNLAENLMKLDNEQKKSINNYFDTYQSISQILDTAIHHAKKLNDQRAESYATGTLGSLYEKNHEWSKAKKMTEHGILIAQGISAWDIAYQWQWQMGRILKFENAIPEAIKYYTQAFNIITDLRSDLAVLTPDIQFSFS